MTNKSMTNRTRVRFAPSPTGYLHVGGARTALFNWLVARKSGGVLVLRVEDTDRDRSKPEHVEAILEGMRWLGLDWDEGPLFQGEGVERHRQDARRLLADGKAYRDFTPPEEFRAAKEAAVAAGSGSVARLPRELAFRLSVEERQARADAGKPFAIRFLVPDGETRWDDLVHGEMKFANAEIEDLVLLRSDGTPTYNLAVVSDDADMEISHVIRGDDHLSNTPKQILLYEALEKAVPTFAHLPMILGPDGKRLSKRHGATAVEAYGAEGILPAVMVNFLALLGWSPGNEDELFSLDQLVETFSMERVLKKSAVFDTTKLEWLNGQYLARTPSSDLVSVLRSGLAASGLDLEGLAITKDEELAGLIDLLKVRSRTVADMVKQSLPYVTDVFHIDQKAARKQWFKDPEGVVVRLEAVAVALEGATWTAEALEENLRGVAEGLGVGAGKVFQPLRLALTGSPATPGIFDLLMVLGRARSIHRVKQAIPMVVHGAAAVLRGATVVLPGATASE